MQAHPTRVQVIIFIVAISLHGIDSLSNNWMIGPNSSTLIRMGAKDAYMMRYKAHVERFFSPIFLHSGIIHIVVNLIIQLRMGLYLERRWGSIKFTCTYVGSGMAGIMMGCVLQPNQISVAASACVMGLTGAYLAHITITWHKFDPFQLKVALFQCIFVLVVTSLEGMCRMYNCDCIQLYLTHVLLDVCHLYWYTRYWAKLY
jgi:membrane associated rhomboid family serine protease